MPDKLEEIQRWLSLVKSPEHAAVNYLRYMVRRLQAAEALCESVYHVPLNTGPTQQELADAWQRIKEEA